MKFPTLYKMSSAGKVQQWEIWTEDRKDGTADIFVRHGQQGGKLQTTSTHIVAGKNIGRANETTPKQQAESEAESQWKKKLDKGYAEQVREQRKLKPMLAQKFSDHHEKLEYPCFFQPKLDGFRCLAYRQHGEIKLESRGSKFFSSLPHIAEAVAKLIKNTGVVLDGELYRHDSLFQELSSAIRKDKPTPQSNLIEYHVYDCYFPDNSSQSYIARLGFLIKLFEKSPDCIKLVPTKVVASYDEVWEKHAEAERDGYEGIILRSMNHPYEVDKRSYGLQKLKKFMDEDFLIVGAEEGKGKFAGMCTFVCKTNEGTEFKCMPMGTEAERREFWSGRERYIGRRLTVRFFEWTTSKNKVPRHPVGVRVREEFDIDKR